MTYTFDGRGLYKSDTLSGALTTTATKNSPKGDYSVKQGDLGANDRNYMITFREGVLRVLDDGGVTPQPQPNPQPQPQQPSQTPTGTLPNDGVLTSQLGNKSLIEPGYLPFDGGLGGLKVGYRIGGSSFYSRAVGNWDGAITDGEKPVPVAQPRFGDVMVCTNPESDCSISIGAKDRQPVIFAR